MKRLLVIPLLLLLFTAVHAQQTFTPICFGTNDTARFTSLIALIGGNNGTIRLPYKGSSRCAVNSLTIPSNVTLSNVDGSGIKINTGQTLTIVGPVSGPSAKFFYNALSGQGTVSFAGNKTIDIYYAAWWGVVGDGVNGVGTDNTPILQRITDTLFADNVPARIRLPKGEVVIAGAHQDGALSLAQWVLPKRTLAQSQYTLAIEGTGDPDMMGLGVTNAGTVLRSTLGSGNGAMIGVKTSGTNNTSALNLTFRDLTFRMPVNPTNSALDLRYVMQPRGFNLRFTTGETFNAWTEPTTATSSALRMPIAFVPAESYFEHVAIDGFYNGVSLGELSRFNNLTIAGCYRAISIGSPATSVHKAILKPVVAINNRHVIYAPDSGATKFAWIEIDVDIERATTAVHGSVWFVGVDEINDSQTPNYLNGPINTHLDLPFGQIDDDELIINGGQYVQLPRPRPYTPTWTNVTVGNGSVNATYYKHQRTVTCKVIVTFGSTTAVSGDIRFSLPVPAEPTSGQADGVIALGTVKAFDGAIGWTGEANLFDVNTGSARFHNVSSGFVKAVAASSTVPITWAAGHKLEIQFSYQSEW